MYNNTKVNGTSLFRAVWSLSLSVSEKNCVLTYNRNSNEWRQISREQTYTRVLLFSIYVATLSFCEFKTAIFQLFPSSYILMSIISHRSQHKSYRKTRKSVKVFIFFMLRTHLNNLIQIRLVTTSFKTSFRWE